MRDKERVIFFSKQDLARGFELQKGEHILRAETNSNYSDINDVLELYNLKQYIDNDIYLKSWTQEDIAIFKQKAIGYGTIVSKFMSSISDENIESLYNQLIIDYKSSFWEVVSNQGFYKNISADKFRSILENNPHFIREILSHKRLVIHYNNSIRDFFMTHPESAEIILSYYEIKDDGDEDIHFPKSLTINDKETIVSNYVDSPKANFNYLRIIQNARNREGFRLSDKTRLKAKRLFENENEKLCHGENSINYGVSVSFPENASKIKDGVIDGKFHIHYTYSLDYIKQYNDPYILFQNFILLFEYLDHQHRIYSVSKKSNLDIFERIFGLHSQNEYPQGVMFNLREMTSQLQIASYAQVLEGMGGSLEELLCQIFTSIFHERYEFADNARLSMPTSPSYLEKVRSIAPEFESILKQYKLFVEDGSIDFELLQISSAPAAIKDIPSLNTNKYLYINGDNKELNSCINSFFSDQTILGYVKPFKNKHYHTLFDLLANEDVLFDNYEDYQKPGINHLIEKGYLYIDDKGYLQFVNPIRLNILHDLYQNEVGSFHWYPKRFQQEAKKMESEGLIYFEDTLFSKPEQSYFNFILNKSEFTNGWDLRNKYLHGTQANPEETEKHKEVYLKYLNLIVLALLKIEDDLMIHFATKQINQTP